MGAIRIATNKVDFRNWLKMPLMVGQSLRNKSPSITDFKVVRCYAIRRVSKGKGPKTHRILKAVHRVREHRKMGIHDFVWPAPPGAFRKVVK